MGCPLVPSKFMWTHVSLLLIHDARDVDVDMDRDWVVLFSYGCLSGIFFLLQKI